MGSAIAFDQIRQLTQRLWWAFTGMLHHVKICFFLSVLNLDSNGLKLTKTDLLCEFKSHPQEVHGYWNQPVK